MKDADGVARMDNYNGMLKLGYTINGNQRIEVFYIRYSSRSDLNLVLKGSLLSIVEGEERGLETNSPGNSEEPQYQSQL